MIRTRCARSGYILLLSVLVIGTISSAVVVSLLLLGIASQRSTFSVEQSSRALALSQACAEFALQALREDLAYAGSEILTGFSAGESCEILAIGGADNNDRIICTEASVGNVYRRIELIVQSLFPVTEIYSWQEVPFFSLCE